MPEDSTFQLKYKIVVKDKNGEIIKEYERKSESFVKNFLMALYSTLVSKFVSLVDVTGAVISSGIVYSYRVWVEGSVSTRPGRLQLNAPEGDATYGIVVGTGTTPVTPDDYKLEQQIPHGSDDGLLYYQKTSVGLPNISDNKAKLSISRVLRNDGSVEISVSEIGVIALVESNRSVYKALIIRDVLPQAEVIPGGGGILIVTYTVST